MWGPCPGKRELGVCLQLDLRLAPSGTVRKEGLCLGA